MKHTTEILGPHQLTRVFQLHEHPLPDLQRLLVRHGSCRTVDPEVFFPDLGQPDLAENAKEICRSCPVRLHCLTVALRNSERHGIWGGLTYKRRLALLEQIRAASFPSPPLSVLTAA